MTDPKRCRATNRAGEQCRRPPMRGGYVCASHGGKTPRALAASERRLAEAEAVREVARLTDAREPLTLPDVYREMLKTAGLVVTWRDVLESRVADLTDYAAAGALGGEQVLADVQLFERAMDRAAKVLELIARLDLDARLTRISETQGAQIAAVMRTALEAGDPTPEQQDAITAALGRELRRLSGGEA